MSVDTCGILEINWPYFIPFCDFKTLPCFKDHKFQTCFCFLKEIKSTSNIQNIGDLPEMWISVEFSQY